MFLGPGRARSPLQSTQCPEKRWKHSRPLAERCPSLATLRSLVPPTQTLHQATAVEAHRTVEADPGHRAPEAIYQRWRVWRLQQSGLALLLP